RTELVARMRPTELLRRQGIPFMEIWYEDLYDIPERVGEKLEVVARVFSFLGLELPSSAEARSRITRLLDPERSRISSEALYRRIPEIDEVESRFGAPENGFLFR